MIETCCFNLIPDSKSAWGQEREVILEREGKGSFGISIVGGKVSTDCTIFTCSVKPTTHNNTGC